MIRVAAVLLGLVIAGCGPVAPNTIVNGWSVGEALACTDEHCLEELRVAETALERQDAGYLPVMSLTIHREGLYPQPDGTMVAGHSAGGCCRVALFRFLDGSLLAFGVGSDLIGGPVLQAYFEPPTIMPPE